MDIPDLALASDVAIPDFGPISAFGLFSWLIPGFAFIGPGLLLLIIGSQVVGGGIFIPITRRVLGGFGLRRSRDDGRDRR